MCVQVCVCAQQAAIPSIASPAQRTLVMKHGLIISYLLHDFIYGILYLA